MIRLILCIVILVLGIALPPFAAGRVTWFGTILATPLSLRCPSVRSPIPFNQSIRIAIPLVQNTQSATTHRGAIAFLSQVHPCHAWQGPRPGPSSVDRSSATPTPVASDLPKRRIANTRSWCLAYPQEHSIVGNRADVWGGRLLERLAERVSVV